MRGAALPPAPSAAGGSPSPLAVAFAAPTAATWAIATSWGHATSPPEAAGTRAPPCSSSTVERGRSPPGVTGVVTCGRHAGPAWHQAVGGRPEVARLTPRARNAEVLVTRRWTSQVPPRWCISGGVGERPPRPLRDDPRPGSGAAREHLPRERD